jgi:hypothetical protein
VGLVSFMSWAMVVILAIFAVTTFASPPIDFKKVERQAAEAQAKAEAAAAQSASEATQTAALADAQAGAPSSTVTQTSSDQVTGQVANTGQALPNAAGDQGESDQTAQAISEAWLVIVESIPKDKRVEAEQSLARHKKRGLNLEIVDTDAYPRLKSGMWTLASGPYDTEKEARAAAAIIKPKVRDLMVRRGL